MGSDPEDLDNGRDHLWEPHEDEPSPDPPPVFSTWPKAYAFVLAFLILLMILFYLFTRAYS